MTDQYNIVQIPNPDRLSVRCDRAGWSNTSHSLAPRNKPCVAFVARQGKDDLTKSSHLGHALGAPTHDARDTYRARQLGFSDSRRCLGWSFSSGTCCRPTRPPSCWFEPPRRRATATRTTADAGSARRVVRGPSSGSGASRRHGTWRRGQVGTHARALFWSEFMRRIYITL